MEPSGIVAQCLKEALANAQVTDICVNGSSGVYIDQGFGMQPLSPPYSTKDFTQEQVREWVLDQLTSVGKTWDARHPFVDASLPSGHRLHVAFPPLSQQGILISLRKIPVSNPNVPRQSGIKLARNRWASSPLFERLLEIVQSGDSILLSGATGSGKTTLANDLLSAVPESERIIALEDTRELAPAHPHFVSLNSRPANADGFGEVTLRTLLRQTLRMRPDRIILGECRGAEVLELLQALNTGHRGAMATLHANSPREALRRIELLCLIASSGSVPIPCIRELLAVGVQWIAQVKRLSEGRRIQELWKIEGREGDTILLRQVLGSTLP
ncbi:MAG: CpaF family protein [Bdellovibrio sp.]|nr:CpaF family protein [Bdellovibrio sp.]